MSINTGLHHSRIIPLVQETADRCLAALLKRRNYQEGRWLVKGDWSDTFCSIEYDGWSMAVYIRVSDRLIFNMNALTENSALTGKMNRLMKRFSLKCGLRDNKPFVKTTDGPWHKWSWTNNDNIAVDLKETRECNRQHLWFMTYC